jgi:gluconokinase
MQTVLPVHNSFFLTIWDSAIQMRDDMNGPLVIMGVAGCGKSSLGAAVAAQLGWQLVEGDEFHPPSNVDKMRQGVALTDADRTGWLDALAAALEQRGTNTVLTCSALKKAYRDRLRQAVPALLFAHLTLTKEQARARVTQRASHYFNANLVDSQFADLESPVAETGVLTLDACESLEQLREHVCSWLQSKELV